ncbi:GlxA family transcriptional regulator [Parafilimonas terrae]|uniref:Transcriptional regulator, AraC family with amidase-like domain n=1 Tax=Parafilimonas terrae TaxID=1465490 RepID=A0A1I5ZCX5_9BACT|nr:helix-turn-helix domain-containing protein [Parafilimonas terrae]SFQ54331.1 transcriptional regulator, AraC family with amidase-like domain [Parafilimonas terrae]
MKKVSILVPESSVMQAIADPQYLFTTVNQFLISAGKEPLFDVELVGVKKEVKLNNGLFSVHTNRQLKEVNKTDLVFIPALFGDMPAAVAKNKAAVPWIVEQYNNGAEVASLCVGAFLLASTGLLNGKKCSTHWGFQNEFREMYPDIEVVEGNIVTEEKRLYSSGGANSYWNLLLHLVEKYTNRETAILASKYFAIDIDRDSQATFAMFKGQKNHTDKEILKAQEYIEKNIHEKISTNELAKITAIGRRTFERRFRQATSNSVLEYIQRIKIEAAKKQFETSRKNINEVMYDVGYTDTKAFRDLFKKLTGLSPIEYRNKYNKMVIAKPEYIS